MSLETDGHLVKVLIEQIPGSDRWSAKVLITWWRDVETYKTEEFEGPTDGFMSRSEAKVWGHELGYQNLNLGKAPQPQFH